MQSTISIIRPISSLTRVHTYSEKHYISKCTIRDLLSAKVANWEHNRPPDLLRCTSIAEYIFMHQPELDWLLYVTYDKTSNTFYIVDGIHRFTALQIIYTENHKPMDFLTPNTFGNSGNATWLYNKEILLSIRVNPSKGETIDLFQNLNKSNPVPELYMENPDEEKRKIIETIVREWMQQYKSHFNISQKPNIPNINRDRFIDLLDGIYQQYHLSPSNAYEILNDKLYGYNNYLRENIPRKISSHSIEKCKKTGCYLFLLSKDVLLERI